ncbi:MULTISPECIES: GGDEF domain-containing protein [unclassified Enterococcus]|uniref:GGDEF domain-containing protein n=1 Tax=unclassified Enterococcus TaxID=2608891 RepID=UPI00155557BD|nr:MULTISPECIES: GGDEF domain-containing protein [unclassified Enterococcus]MBS7576611.1 GGDEF domain-containing protein [Enterococcus sp. MMGLQ5-2]MBS7583902.1 GGDEF domain-containing protein [Enterococcus sp. MMGLQ5-1]NPD11763.1 GGDEF domain-containing protein [Enterococcus sp. MMGLQ5-1]NPD36448.1 GGDEF domain-containing protein [Enterococcus sp. MMGLQ5-2]
MIVSILADMAVLLIVLIFFFLTRDEAAVSSIDHSPKRRLNYIVIVIVVGLLLLQFSVVVDGAHYDYRFLLYVFSIKYIGPRVTLPSIFIISIFRFLWSVNQAAINSFIYGMILIATLFFVYRFLEKRINDFGQLIILSLYTLFVGAFINLVVYGNFFKDHQIYLVLIISSSAMIIAFLWIIHQIRSIKEKSEFDYLTGLKNNRRFYLDLSRLKNESTYHLSMIDIDFFKSINDQFGHLTGDEVLKAIAKIFMSYRSDKVRFYRTGGEEFTMIIENYNDEQANELMASVLTSVAAIDYDLIDKNGQPVAITISIGISNLINIEEARSAIHRADLNLYKAKAAGRNRIIFD